MKIIWTILKFILKIVCGVPSGAMKLLFSAIKELKAKSKSGTEAKNKKKTKQESYSKEVVSLVMALGVVIPLIYAIIIIVLEYITKAQSGVWDSPNPLRPVKLPLGTICMYGVLAMIIATGVEFFQKKAETGSSKKTFAIEKERIIDLLKNSAWLMIALPLATWVTLIGSLIAITIFWGIFIIGFCNLLFSGEGSGTAGGFNVPSDTSRKSKEKTSPVKDGNVKVFSNSAKFIKEYSYNYSSDVILAQQGLGSYNFVCKAKDFDNGAIIIKLENGKRITKNDIGKRR